MNEETVLPVGDHTIIFAGVKCRLIIDDPQGASLTTMTFVSPTKPSVVPAESGQLVEENFSSINVLEAGSRAIEEAIEKDCKMLKRRSCRFLPIPDIADTTTSPPDSPKQRAVLRKVPLAAPPKPYSRPANKRPKIILPKVDFTYTLILNSDDVDLNNNDTNNNNNNPYTQRRWNFIQSLF